MKVLDLFSGIGGFSLGLERAGFETVAFCEIDPFCRQVLQKHWPHVPIHEDITELDGRQYRHAVDLVCGGFPCQDISAARGKDAAGIDGDKSGLWREMARLIREVRPRYAVMENSSMLLSRGLGRVVGDMAAIGYDCVWHCIPASDLGAPHERDRIWIIAYSASGRKRTERWAEKCSQEMASDIEHAYRNRLETTHELREWLFSTWGPDWAGEAPSAIQGVDDGIPDWAHRTRVTGNAVVPQIPELIGRAILAAS